MIYRQDTRDLVRLDVSVLGARKEPPTQWLS